MFEFVLAPAPLTPGEIAGIVLGTLSALALLGLSLVALFYYHNWKCKRLT